MTPVTPAALALAAAELRREAARCAARSERYLGCAVRKELLGMSQEAIVSRKDAAIYRAAAERAIGQAEDFEAQAERMRTS